jgi:hypothetical protein
MLDIRKVESKNEVYVSGILNELDIVEGITKDGRKWIRGTANVKIDQEINGQMTEDIVPIKMFSMRAKKDGSDNKIYDIIASYKDRLTSLAAADDESQASRVTVSAKIEENPFVSKDGQLVSTWQLTSNFINNKRDSDEEAAKFIFSGVVGKIIPEYNREGEETGRAIVQFIVIGYNGKANRIDLIADGSKRDYIETNWNVGDTVQVTGRINVTKKIVTWTEEQGFGEPITRSRTESRKELLITGGSPCGLEESLSYDADSVKQVLSERSARNEELIAKSKTSSKPQSKSVKRDLGF